ncbi:MAG TPA: hypothetical protein VNF49_03265 [Candidatus Binataceae bacterium]|nr:hypothetical protein [Candidatus Binataceae bacterium]
MPGIGTPRLDSGFVPIDKPCMKLRHIAAVALTGWFLITPPQANSHYDTSAPLSKWKIEGGAATREQCKATQASLGSRALKQGRPGDAEAVKDAQCVSTDDPRLEGN